MQSAVPSKFSSSSELRKHLFSRAIAVVAVDKPLFSGARFEFAHKHEPCVHHSGHHHHHHHPAGQLVGPRRSFWNTKCSCQFSCLPDELMMFNVFTFLNAVELCAAAQVCSRWRFLTGDRLLWRSLDFGLFQTLAARLPRSLLPLAPPSLPSSPSLPVTAAPAPSLPSSSSSSVFDDAELGSAPPRGFVVTDGVVANFSHRFGKHAERLKLCNIASVSTELLLSLPPLVPQLTELHLCNMRAVNDAVVLAFAAACPQLQIVSLFGCTQVTDASVTVLCQTLGSLKELSVRGCIQLTDSSLAVVSPSLECLNLAGCKKITSNGLLSVANRCPRLGRLNCHGVNVNDQAIAAIAAGCPRLTVAHFSSANPFGGGSRLTDASLAALSNCTQLNLLNLQGANNLTDAGLINLVQRRPPLTRLNIGGCHKLTDASITALASLPTLTHLSVFQCFKLTDASVWALAKGLHSLQHLDVHGCVGLTAASLQYLMEPVLPESLALSDTESDVGSLDASSNDGSEERRASVSRTSASLLDDDDAGSESPTFVNAPFALPHLRALDIGSCRNIAPDVVQAFVQARPVVQVTSI